MMYQYPTNDMDSVHRKNMFISEISFGILYIIKRKNVLQMFFFNLVEHKVRFVHQQTRILNIIAFTVFQAISEFVRGNMAPCR